jgi:hypothetical protein
MMCVAVNTADVSSGYGPDTSKSARCFSIHASESPLFSSAWRLDAVANVARPLMSLQGMVPTPPSPLTAFFFLCI